MEQCTFLTVHFLRTYGPREPLSVASVLLPMLSLTYSGWPERLIVTCSYVLFGLKITFLSYLKLKVFRTGREKTTSIPLVCPLMNPFLTCRTYLFLILSNSFLVHAL